MKKDNHEIGWEGLDLFGLPRDRDMWIAVVTVVMKFPFPYITNANKNRTFFTI
jgi:hypothetical protein